MSSLWKNFCVRSAWHPLENRELKRRSSGLEIVEDLQFWFFLSNYRKNPDSVDLALNGSFWGREWIIDSLDLQILYLRVSWMSKCQVWIFAPTDNSWCFDLKHIKTKHQEIQDGFPNHSSFRKTISMSSLSHYFCEIQDQKHYFKYTRCRFRKSLISSIQCWWQIWH